MENLVANELLKIAKLLSASIPSFTKFVKEYEVDDYPYGRDRTKANWKVENKGSKQRVCRITFNPKTGRENSSKCTTLAPSAIIGIANDGFAYPIAGRPGQIMVWSGNMKHTLGAVLPKDSLYNKLADELGFRRVPNSVTVKETSNGAQIDGLQGKSVSLKEIMTLGGLSKEVIDTEVAKLLRKTSGDFMKETFTVSFKPELKRKPYIIEVYS